jgi:colanic acid/amylovoran biosynthesis glycosyltransferase
LMTEAHLFLLSSVTAEDGDQEGTPVSLIEAQACGLPVLSSFHSGIPEIVRDGQSGFLVAERDVVGLAERIVYLVGHPEIWPGMGCEGRRHVETHHDIRRLNGDLDRLYREVIGRSNMQTTTDDERALPHKDRLSTSERESSAGRSEDTTPWGA